MLYLCANGACPADKPLPKPVAAFSSMAKCFEASDLYNEKRGDIGYWCIPVKVK